MNKLNILIPKEILQTAVDALEWNSIYEVKLIATLRALLDQPPCEPVATCFDDKYWIALNTEAGQEFNDSLKEVGAKRIVYAIKETL